jgi:hypothetical protein
MVKLEPVILVRELPPARAVLRQHLPSLRDLLAPTPSPQEPAILSYLAQGVVCGIYNDRGLLFDVLQHGQRIDVLSQQDPHLASLTIQPSLMLTDGAWVWPGVLPYYLARYHVQLPARFLQFAEGRHWRIDPAAINPAELSWDAYDAVVDVPAGASR